MLLIVREIRGSLCNINPLSIHCEFKFEAVSLISCTSLTPTYMYHTCTLIIAPVPHPSTGENANVGLIAGATVSGILVVVVVIVVIVIIWKR